MWSRGQDSWKQCACVVKWEGLVIAQSINRLQQHSSQAQAFVGRCICWGFLKFFSDCFNILKKNSLLGHGLKT